MLLPTSGCVDNSNAAYSLNGKGAHVYNNSYTESSSENVYWTEAFVTVYGGVPTNQGYANIGAHIPIKGKLDHWRWIKQVEPLGVFESIGSDRRELFA